MYEKHKKNDYGILLLMMLSICRLCTKVSSTDPSKGERTTAYLMLQTSSTRPKASLNSVVDG